MSVIVPTEASPEKSGPAVRPAPAGAPGAAAAHPPLILNFLRCLGLALNNISLYGVNHKGARQALGESFAALDHILAEAAALTISVSADGALLVDGRPVELSTAPIVALSKRLQVLETDSFTLTRGITGDELARFMELLAAPPAMINAVGGTLTALVQRGSLQHVRTQRVSYQLVTDEQMVVARDAAESAAAASTLTVGEIIAFLKGEAAGEAGKLPEEIRELLSDTDKLAALILKAADIRPDQAAVAGGESLGDLVIGCIRRLHNQARASATAKTASGKKDLMKSLVLLEQSVLEKLRAAAGEEAAQTAGEEISTAVGEMVEDLRVDALAVEYLKKRQLIEDSERRLLRYIKARRGKAEFTEDLKDLQRRLTEEGLDHKGWEELLAKSIPAGSSAWGGSPPGSSPALTMLLIQLTDMLDPARRTPGQGLTAAELAPVVTQINQKMTEVIAGAEQKSAALQNMIRGIKTLPDKFRTKELIHHMLSREQILVLLAEIVQELRQPLTVIISTTEMVSQGLLGRVTVIQKEMLDMAVACGQRIEKILDNLAAVSGLPATLHPDAQILARLNDE